jgi:cob(I)alamin adenosyltransferase
MKIYTKSGDDGTTALFDGTRVSKDDDRVDVYGDIDETNSAIGLAASYLKTEEAGLQENLFDVQRDLFALGAKLANPAEKKQKEKADFTEEKILRLEYQIDEMEKSLKPMTNFILSTGCPASAALHLARTICRRAERRLVTFMRDQSVDPIYEKYLNRLSDYLFVAARFANHLEETDDIPW